MFKFRLVAALALLLGCVTPAASETFYTKNYSETRNVDMSSAVSTGGDLSKTQTANFSAFTAPRYVGKFTSFTLSGNYRATLDFNSLGPTTQGDSWSGNYSFQFAPSPRYPPSIVGTITPFYACQSTVCGPGGSSRVAEGPYSYSASTGQLGAFSRAGSAGGPITVATSLALEGTMPATLSSTQTGTIQVTGVWKGSIPIETKQQAAKLSDELGHIGNILLGASIVADPTRSLVRAGLFVSNIALEAAVIDDPGIRSAYSVWSNSVQFIHDASRIASDFLNKVPGGTNPLAILLSVASNASNAFSFVAGQIADDPPSGDFASVLSLQATDISALRTLFGDDPLNQAALDMIASLLDGTQALEVILASMERFQGAVAAGDDAAALAQLAQLSQAYDAYYERSGRLAEDWDAFFAMLEDSGVSLVGGDGVDAASILAALTPEELSELLNSGLGGLSAAEIEALLAAAGNTQFGPITLGDAKAVQGGSSHLLAGADLTGGQIAGVPEPGTWALLIVGMMIVGASLRASARSAV